MANFNFNKVILGGRITADPELKQTQNGTPVCSFSVAVNRRTARSKDGEQAQQQTDFINVVAWRQQAEFISRYFRRGSSICITGSLQVRQWNDNQGQKRYSTEVIADEIHFVDSKGEGSSNQSNAYAPESYAPTFASQEENAPKFLEMSNDDDLPF